MNQYRHARISQYIPQGYNQAVLDNAAQFADRLGDALEQNGRNATLFVSVAKSGNAYLQTGDKQMIFLNQDSLKGNPNEVSGYIGKDKSLFVKMKQKSVTGLSIVKKMNC